MIKINVLLEAWKIAEYDKEAIKSEYEKLENVIQVLYENALITREAREKDSIKLKKAYQKAINQ